MRKSADLYIRIHHSANHGAGNHSVMGDFGLCDEKKLSSYSSPPKRTTACKRKTEGGGSNK